jgi:NADPH2:quinone reductase
MFQYKLKLAWDFGLMHPLQFLLKSNGVIGLNMLRIAEQSPSVLGDVMQKVVDLADQNILKPHIGGEFTAKEIADAHHLLESRNSIGKVVVNW